MKIRFAYIYNDRAGNGYRGQRNFSGFAIPGKFIIPEEISRGIPSDEFLTAERMEDGGLCIPATEDMEVTGNGMYFDRLRVIGDPAPNWVEKIQDLPRCIGAEKELEVNTWGHGGTTFVDALTHLEKIFGGRVVGESVAPTFAG